jgi:hypothetical protein
MDLIKRAADRNMRLKWLPVFNMCAKWLSRGVLTVVAIFVLIYVAQFAMLVESDIVDGRRFPPDPVQNKCTKRHFDPSLTPRPNSGVVKTIHLTNLGAFVDRCEFTDALDELVWDREQARVGHSPLAIRQGAASLPKLTVLYVHGWKHDASSNDPDSVRFKGLIERLAAVHGGKRQVLGIYVTWNATFYGIPFLDNLTFWSKKAVADRIAESAVVTRIVSAMGALRDREAQDLFIAIGHSFGARILFAATSQSLIYETANAHPGSPVRRSISEPVIVHPGSRVAEYKIVNSATDAVILLNPAFEASMYTSLDGITRIEERFSPKQAPLLISISTDNDFVTRYAYPIGQSLGLAYTAAERTTLGNFEPYFTHALFPSDGTKCSKIDDPENFEAAGFCLARIGREIPVHGGRRFKGVQAFNPFYVARTTSELIDGHNGIWNDKFSNWVFYLIEDLRLRHEEAAKND